MLDACTRIFDRMYEIWNKHGWLVLVVLAFVAFGLYWFFYRKDKKSGSYNENYFYDSVQHKPNVQPNAQSNVQHYNEQQPSYHMNQKRSPGKDSKGERICRSYLEQRFQKNFDKARPKYMFNSITGKPLEFDCFNKELSLACEYNGRQHYEYVPYFHKSRADFQNQMYRDRMKREICVKLGIILIEVPYNIKPNDIPNYIEQELLKNGY